MTGRGPLELGELISIEIAALVIGGFVVNAVYKGDPRGDDVVVEIGKYAALVDVAVVIPSVPLKYEE